MAQWDTALSRSAAPSAADVGSPQRHCVSMAEWLTQQQGPNQQEITHDCRPPCLQAPLLVSLLDTTCTLLCSTPALWPCAGMYCRAPSSGAWYSHALEPSVRTALVACRPGQQQDRLCPHGRAAGGAGAGGGHRSGQQG